MFYFADELGETYLLLRDELSNINKSREHLKSIIKTFPLHIGKFVIDYTFHTKSVMTKVLNKTRSMTFVVIVGILKFTPTFG